MALKLGARHTMSFADNLSRVIVGGLEPMVALKKSVIDVAEHNIPVLITGPSGSGKEVVAQALAEMSGRSGRLIDIRQLRFNPT